MTLDQGAAFAVVFAAVGLFVWNRLPYDLVAVLALLAGIGTGVVPMEHAFDGFGDPVVITVAAALLCSTAVARSGALESLLRPVLSRLRTPQMQVVALAGACIMLSTVTEGVGALAILMPLALQVTRRTGTSPSSVLMPMSFASILGGFVTQVGSSTNIVVAKVRADVTGTPFGLFDFTPVGLSVALSGLLVLVVGWRLLPRGRRAAAGMDGAIRIDAYTAEATLAAEAPARSVAELEALGEGEAAVIAVIRERFRRYAPTPTLELRAGDTVLLEGEPEALERLIARGRLQLAGEATGGDMSVVEGVVMVDSPLIDRTPAQAGLGGRVAASLLAVSRSGERFRQRLAGIRFRAGDVIVLKGRTESLPDALGDLRILPLAERQIALGNRKRSWVPIAILLVALMAAVVKLAPVSVALFAAAGVMLLLRVLSVQEAYEAIEWPVLVLIGALIPVAGAIQATGGTDLIAAGLAGMVQGVNPVFALVAVMALAVAITPFLNNAAVVLIAGPIAAKLASGLDLNPDPFLMAVAVGASCDFLTPIGNQVNTLVMGPGGYRFADYGRLGLPLTVVVLGVGTAAILLFWPLRPG